MNKKNILPGFGLSLGFTVFYLSLIMLIPISALFLKTVTINWNQFCQIIISPRLIASLRLSFGVSFFAALNNAFFGIIIAWVITRYHFVGKRFLEAMIDLPFAMPTAVAGIALTTIYSQNGFFGKLLAPLGVKIAFTPIGIWVALTFIGIPFVVRTLQPILQDLDADVEEAAASLGANRWQTFYKVILPYLVPGWLTGFTLAFARGLGEYGSVVFISGNMPMKTEIAPLLIITKLEQFDLAGAAVIAVVMLVISFILFFLINFIQSQGKKYHVF